jgi:hypothetical protein
LSDDTSGFVSDVEDCHVDDAAPTGISLELLLAEISQMCRKLSIESALARLLRLMYGALSDADLEVARKMIDSLWGGKNKYSGSTLHPSDPLLFWLNVVNQGEDPKVAGLAVRLLITPASETCCERAFSSLRKIFRRERMRMHIRSIKWQLFMKELQRPSKSNPKEGGI